MHIFYNLTFFITQFVHKCIEYLVNVMMCMKKKMDMFYIMNNFPIGGIYTCQLSNIIAYNRILYST